MSSHHSDIDAKQTRYCSLNQPGFSIEDLEVMGTEKHTRKCQVPQVLTLTANSLGDTDSRNHDNTSMFPVNMYCVFSVNASVSRTASVVLIVSDTA